MFTLRSKFFKFGMFNKEIVPYTVTGDKHIPRPTLAPWDPDYKDPNAKKMSFGNSSFASKRIIEKVHPTNTVQLETLDD